MLYNICKNDPLPLSTYTGVFAVKVKSGRFYKWVGRNKEVEKSLYSQRECALWYDKQMIKEGKEPVNILKKLQW